MGRHSLRVAAVRRGKVLAASARQTVFAYEDIAWSTYCDFGCRAGTLTVGGQLFAYAQKDDFPSQDANSSDQDFTAEESVCRSATVLFGVADDEDDDIPFGLSVTTETFDRQIQPGAHGDLTEFTFQLRDSSNWYLTAWHEDTRGRVPTIAWDGTLSCWDY